MRGLRLGRSDHLYRHKKAIPTTRQGFDVMGCYGRISKRLSQFIDSCIQSSLEIHEGVFRPDGLPKILSIDNLALSTNELGQYLKWLILQLDPNSTSSQLALLEVDLE